MKAQIVENYLRMMKLSFRECYRVLKPRRYYAMVVSKYHSWIINGEEQRIETSKVLADLGISEGFKLAEIIPHGLSKADKGKINVEDILVFQKRRDTSYNKWVSVSLKSKQNQIKHWRIGL